MPCPSPLFRSLCKTKTTAEHGMSHQHRWSDTHYNVTRASMMTSWDSKGRPRQFRLIAENSLCSILFHLLVPGGRWQTVMVSPVWAANPASSVFHSRSRDPFDPPASAVINNLREPG